jgi:hypothetical protein
MAGQLERGQVSQRSILIGRIALDGIDDYDRVQEVQHLWISRRYPKARNVQFLVPLSVFSRASFVFSKDIRGSPPWKAACPLLGCDLADHVGQATPRRRSRRGTDGHAHRAGRHLRIVHQR